MIPFPETIFDATSFFGSTSSGRASYQEGDVVFAQGDDANSIFYIRSGKIKKTYVSHNGKERIVAILGAGEFVGVGCVIGRKKRLMTATAMTACSAARIEKSVMVRALYDQPSLAEMFISSLIDRNYRYQEDLVDHLFNSSEKRLARTLLHLSNINAGNAQETVLPKISQETLAEIVGTTRSRVNYFMKKFRHLGLIEYGDGIHVRRSLSDVLYERFDYNG
jgi:CRP-like cAMP-binding protein